MQRRVAQALLCVSVFNLGMDITPPKVVNGNISISSSDIAKAEEIAGQPKTVTFNDLSEQSVTKSVTIPKLKSVSNIKVNTGNVDYVVNGDQVTFKLTNGKAKTSVYNPKKYSKQVADTAISTSDSFNNTKEYSDAEGYTGILNKDGSSKVISGSPGDSKTVEGETNANYNKEGYSGTLSPYVYSGNYIPGDSKTVSGETSSYYNKNGYSGTLSPYVYSGSSGNSKYVYGETSPYYNRNGYSGTLSSYLYSGSYTPGDSKYVSGKTSSYYYENGYSGTLSPYLYSGSYGDSKTVGTTRTGGAYDLWKYSHGSWHFYGSRRYSNIPGSINYNSGGYSGTLTLDDSSRAGGGVGGGTPTGSGSEGEIRRGADYTDTYYYSGTVSKPDTRVYRYSGTVTRPSIDTRDYRYEGTVTKPDTRVYRYSGTVTKPAVDTRVYRYSGTVIKPDTKVWQQNYNGIAYKGETENTYEYTVTFDYIDQKMIDEENAYKAQFTTVTSTVVKAESSKLQEDVDAARTLVDALRPADKTTLNDRLDEIQKYIDTENAYKAQLATATSTVVKAESSKLQEDVDAARTLVDVLRPTDKTALNDRLDEIQKYIDIENAYKAQLATATSTVVKAESSKLQVDVDSARTLVDALRPADKTALNDRLDEVQKYIDTENAYKAQLATATNAVVKAESSKLQENVDAAKTLVDALRPADKTALNNRLDKVQKAIDLQNAINKATATVEKAESSMLQVDVNSAKKLVDSLPECNDKTDLNNRLDEVQKAIDLQNAINRATAAVEKAESSELQEDVNSARTLVNTLPDGKEKTDLNHRLDIVQQIIINNKIDELEDKTDVSQDELDELDNIIDNLPAGEAKDKAEKDLQNITNLQVATRLVEKAEKTLLREDYNTAYSAVMKLPPMKGKSGLINRLIRLNATISKKENEKKLQTLADVRNAEKLVNKASISKSTEDIAKAQEAINKLPEGKNRDRLQTWLDSFVNNINKLNYQRDAERAIKYAEIVRTQEAIDAAQDKIDVLPDTMNIKTAYQSRLDRVTIKGSPESMSTLDKLRAAEKAVKRAESNHTVESVTEAEKLVNALSDNDRKEFLQLRVTAEKLMQEAEKKPSEEKITAVQTAIGKLPYGNVKYNLLKRIAAVQKQLK